MIRWASSAPLPYRLWIYRLLPLVVALIFSTAATLPLDWDPAIEQAWAELITTRLRAGEAIWLPSPWGKFLGLYMPAIGRGPNHGAVVMLPAPTTHPDSDPISSLRTLLPRQGWHTLALQLPTMVLDASPAAYEHALPAACARLNAAVTWCAAREITNVVVLGHGLGAAVAAACIADAESNIANTVRGLVLLGVGGPARITPLPPTLDPSLLLEKIILPILDLYGEDDLAPVRTGAPAREAGRRQRLQRYVQVIIPGAGHRLTGFEEIVVGRVAGWLRRYAAEARN